MKDRITITDVKEIQYISKLIENDIAFIEANLKNRQVFLQKFKSFKGT